jgi:hypothetical protein
LRIVVFGQDNLTNSYAVGASGNITMPLIGAVHARGLTPAELSQTIAAKLRQGYLREPHDAVEVELYRPFFILGEVNFPGQYPYVPNMTAETAVAIAGGFTPRAWRPTVPRRGSSFPSSLSSIRAIPSSSTSAGSDRTPGPAEWRRPRVRMHAVEAGAARAHDAGIKNSGARAWRASGGRLR